MAEVFQESLHINGYSSFGFENMDSVCIENLSFTYSGEDKRSLENLDLRIKKGEFVVVAGDSKSGKTSLLYLIAGIIPHFYHGVVEGTVCVNGRDVISGKEENTRRDVKIVLNNPHAQISGMASTVFEEVALGIRGKKIEKSEIRERVQEVLVTLGISDLKDRDPGTLSGGETQRMVIASVLVSDFHILLMDDPTSKLDPEGQNRIFKISKDLAQKGKTVVIASNDIERAAKYSHRLIVMAEGKIVMDDNSQRAASDIKIKNYGIELQRYTEAAFLGRERGLWPKEKELPATLEDACKGFSWISE